DDVRIDLEGDPARPRAHPRPLSIAPRRHLAGRHAEGRDWVADLVKQPGRADGRVPREGQLGRWDEDGDPALVEVVNEDGFAVPKLSRDREAPVGWDRLPIEEYRKEVAGRAVWTEEEARGMESRQPRL